MDLRHHAAQQNGTAPFAGASVTRASTIPARRGRGDLKFDEDDWDSPRAEVAWSRTWPVHPRAHGLSVCCSSQGWNCNSNPRTAGIDQPRCINGCLCSCDVEQFRTARIYVFNYRNGDRLSCLCIARLVCNAIFVICSGPGERCAATAGDPRKAHCKASATVDTVKARLKTAVAALRPAVLPSEE